MADNYTYTTRGMPPAPEISKTTVPMAGLLVDIYGLEELPPALTSPVSCLWLLHPRTRTRARMEDIAKRTLAAWHSHPVSAKRGLVALAFDMPNHGSRLVSEQANRAWDEDDGNEQHALDMMGIIKGGKSDMAALMDLVAGYLGRDNVDGHVCLGWSLGGHSAWQAWFGEERIDAAVVVVGCPDYMSLMSQRAKKANLVSSSKNSSSSFIGSRHFPRDLVKSCLAHDPKGLLFGTEPIPSLPLTQAEQERLRPVLDARIRGKKLLLCSGRDDELVPYANAESLIAVLREAAGGWYNNGGVTVDDRVYDAVGHWFSKEMVQDAVGFLVDAVARGPRRRQEDDKSRM